MPEEQTQQQAEEQKLPEDLRFIRDSDVPGHQAAYNLAGEKLEEWPVDRFGSRTGDVKTFDGPEAPAAGGAQEGKAAEPEEIAALRAERDRLRGVIAPDHPAPSFEPPADDGTGPQPVFEDVPDWNDETLFPDEEAVLKGQKEYFGRKAREHAKAALEHEQKRYEEHRKAVTQQEEAQAAEGRRIETAKQIYEALGVDEEGFRKVAADFSTVRHPAPVDPNFPNPVANYLYVQRDRHLLARAQRGLPTEGYESVAEMQTEQFRDMDYARALAGVVPDTVTGGMLVGALAEQRSPTRVARFLTTAEGQQVVEKIMEAVGEVSPQRMPLVHREMYDVLARIEAGLEASGRRGGRGAQAAGSPAPAPAAPTPRAVPARRSVAPIRTAPRFDPNTMDTGRFNMPLPAEPGAGAAPAKSGREEDSFTPGSREAYEAMARRVWREERAAGNVH